MKMAKLRVRKRETERPFSQTGTVFTIRGGKKTRENSENDENRFEDLSRYPTTTPLSRLAVAKRTRGKPR